MRADARELMHRRECTDGRPLLDYHVSGKRGIVGHDDMVAHKAIVRDVRVSHEQAVAAELSQPPATGRAAVDGDAFADLVMVADLEARLLTLELQVLRLHAQRHEWENPIIAADLCGAIYDNVPDELVR